MVECKHEWVKHIELIDFPSSETHFCAKCGIDKETWLEQQIQQAQATIKDLEEILEEKEGHFALCRETNKRMYQQIKEKDATIAAIREGLELSHELFRLGEMLGYNSSIPDEMTDELSRAYEILEIVDKALSDTAGAELLEKIDRLEMENKALRCCGNCQHSEYGYEGPECTLYHVAKGDCDDNDLKHWQIAERLVNKGEHQTKTNR